MAVGVGGGEGEAKIHVGGVLEDGEAELGPGVVGLADGGLVLFAEGDFDAAGGERGGFDAGLDPEAEFEARGQDIESTKVSEFSTGLAPRILV